MMVKASVFTDRTISTYLETVSMVLTLGDGDYINMLLYKNATGVYGRKLVYHYQINSRSNHMTYDNNRVTSTKVNNLMWHFRNHKLVKKQTCKNRKDTTIDLFNLVIDTSRYFKSRMRLVDSNSLNDEELKVAHEAIENGLNKIIRGFYER